MHRSFKQEKPLHVRGQTVKLNIGGKIFKTSVANLSTQTDSYFEKLFSGNWKKKLDDNGAIFIDRDGSLFHYLIEFHRDGPLMVLPSEDPKEMLSIREEAEFYELHNLVQLIDDMLLLNKKTAKSAAINLNSRKELAGLNPPVGDKVYFRLTGPPRSEDVEIDLETLLNDPDFWFYKMFSPLSQLSSLKRDEKGRFVINRDFRGAQSNFESFQKELAALKPTIGDKLKFHFAGQKQAKDVEVDMDTLQKDPNCWFYKTFSSDSQFVSLPRDEEGRFVINQDYGSQSDRTSFRRMLSRMKPPVRGKLQFRLFTPRTKDVELDLETLLNDPNCWFYKMFGSLSQLASLRRDEDGRFVVNDSSEALKELSTMKPPIGEKLMLRFIAPGTKGANATKDMEIDLETLLTDPNCWFYNMFSSPSQLSGLPRDSKGRFLVDRAFSDVKPAHILNETFSAIKLQQKVVLRFVRPGADQKNTPDGPVDVEIDLEMLLADPNSWFYQMFGSGSCSLPQDEEGRFLIYRDKHKAAAMVVKSLAAGENMHKFLRCVCLQTNLLSEARFFNVMRMVQICEREVKRSIKGRRSKSIRSGSPPLLMKSNGARNGPNGD